MFIVAADSKRFPLEQTALRFFKRTARGVFSHLQKIIAQIAASHHAILRIYKYFGIIIPRFGDFVY